VSEKSGEMSHASVKDAALILTAKEAIETTAPMNADGPLASSQRRPCASAAGRRLQKSGLMPSTVLSRAQIVLRRRRRLRSMCACAAAESLRSGGIRLAHILCRRSIARESVRLRLDVGECLAPPAPAKSQRGLRHGFTHGAMTSSH
jgi:hypothetical protein